VVAIFGSLLLLFELYAVARVEAHGSLYLEHEKMVKMVKMVKMMKKW